MPTIGTISDRFIDPFTMTGDDINIWDIAWSLSNQCRYMGHCPVNWSVLSHTALAYQLYRADVKAEIDIHKGIQILLHDASEAYIGDVVRPIKHRPEFAFYRQLENTILDTIFKRFGYAPDEVDWNTIKRYDDQALAVEYYKFYPTQRGNRRVEFVYPHGGVVDHQLMVAKPFDFVTFLREQVIAAQKAPDISTLFDLPPSLVGVPGTEFEEPQPQAVDPIVRSEMAQVKTGNTDAILSRGIA